MLRCPTKRGPRHALSRAQSRPARHHHRRGVRGRSPTLGALIVSLPLVSLLGILWLWRDTGNTARIAAHAESTFWYVLPTLPMFLVLPALLRHGVGFWTAMLACCALTFVLYLLTVWALGKFGFSL
jgi:hypothetical protein